MKWLASPADMPEMVNHTLVTATALNLLQTRLSWPEPEDNNAAITAYMITFCTTVDDDCLPNTLTTVMVDNVAAVDGMVTSIIEADPNRRIRVKIVAVNAIGDGPAPEEFFFFNTSTSGEWRETARERVCVMMISRGPSPSLCS